MGARYANLNTDLSAHATADGSSGTTRPASGGRHPLPARATFARWVASQGVAPHTQVVVYDRNGANYCGRLWWMLKWCGHEAWPCWTAACKPGKPWAAKRQAGRQTPLGQRNLHWARLWSGWWTRLRCWPTWAQPARPCWTHGVPRATVARWSPWTPVAGHIPGALNRPFTENIGADGCFKPAHVLRAELPALLGGRDPATVVHQCGSGVSAVPNLLAMEIAGLGRQALYAGSWSEWCSESGGT
jgi:thiosulfate/3-mercaptopyruvate sulfurtransferase